jgi:hypothetical protein
LLWKKILLNLCLTVMILMMKIYSTLLELKIIICT